MLTRSPNPCAVEGLEVREAGRDVIVHDPACGKIHVLNRSGGIVLELCDGERDVDAIAASLAAKLDAPIERVRGDVEGAIAAFRQLGFVR